MKTKNHYIKLLTYAFGCLLATHSSDGFAQYYKCTNLSGAIEFSDKPCSSASRKESVNPIPNTLNASGSREQTLMQQNAELRRRLEERQSYSDNSGYGRTQADLQAERVDSGQCAQAQRAYSTISGRISPNPNEISAARSAMFAACGTPEPPPPARQVIRVNPAPQPPKICYPSGGLVICP